MATDVEARLAQGISPSSSFALALNGVLGSGLFALPAIAAATSGMSSPWLFAIGAGLIAPIVAVMGWLAGSFPRTGGAAVYAREAFGSRVGALTGWLGFCAAIFGMAASTNALVAYASALVPWLGEPVPRVAFIFLLWTTLAGVNVAGVRKGALAVWMMTALKIAPLVALAVAGVWMQRARLPSIWAGGIAWPSEAALLPMVFAYVGFEGALAPAAETQNPKRSLPRATAAAIAIAALLYVAMQAAYVLNIQNLFYAKAGSLPAAAPLADLSSIVFGATGRTIAALMACLSIGGAIAAAAVTQPRYLLFLAEHGDLPKAFSRLHPRFRTPVAAIALTALLDGAIASFGNFTALASMVVLAKALIYGTCAVCWIRLATRLESSAPRLAVAALAVCSAGFISSRATFAQCGTLGAFILAGVLAHGVRRARLFEKLALRLRLSQEHR